MRFFSFLFLFIFFQKYGIAQICKTDARCINTKEGYLQSLKDDPKKKLVALQKVISNLVVNMPYATTHNFTKTVLYHNPVAYLREEPAYALKQAQEALMKKGLALKIYDAFRPFSVTCKIWLLATDRHYVANPRKGSNHNRGIAIDVTVIDLKTGKELDMGTAYDNFTDSAHHDFYRFEPQVLANRKLLKSTMKKYGFGMVPTEWWHYQWLYNRENFEVIDLDFDALKEIVR